MLILTYGIEKVFAQASPVPKPTIKNYIRFTNWYDAIQAIPNYLTIIGGVLFFVSILAAGILYLSSFGNEEQATRAKTALTAAAIGIILVVFGQAIANYLVSSIW